MYLLWKIIEPIKGVVMPYFAIKPKGSTEDTGFCVVDSMSKVDVGRMLGVKDEEIREITEDEYLRNIGGKV